MYKKGTIFYVKEGKGTNWVKEGCIGLIVEDNESSPFCQLEEKYSETDSARGFNLWSIDNDAMEVMGEL